VGKLHVAGLTKNQCEDMIKNKIAPYLAANENPVVTVRMASYRVTITGEVKSPGVIPVSTEKISIIEALAQAGDLTIYGKRDNIILIREKAEPSQQFHFFSYYIDARIHRSEKKPSYASLKCPQLIMYIVEMAGLDVEIVDKAFNILKDFEEKRGLKETEKGATYLEKIEGNPSEVFKFILHISDIQKIITESSSYEEIVEKVSRLK